MSAFRFRGINLTGAGPIRLDQTQARKIGEGPLLIMEGDGFGVMCSEQNLFGHINAHVMDSRPERMALTSGNSTPSRTVALVNKVKLPLTTRTIKVGEQLLLVTTA